MVVPVWVHRDIGNLCKLQVFLRKKWLWEEGAPWCPELLWPWSLGRGAGWSAAAVWGHPGFVLRAASAV